MRCKLLAQVASRLALLGLNVALVADTAEAQIYTRSSPRRYSGIDAGQESYLIHENLRRGAITTQMALNDDMLMLRGLPPRYLVVSEANLLNDWQDDSPLPTDAWEAAPYYLAPPVTPGVSAIDFDPDQHQGQPGQHDQRIAPAPNPPRPANGVNQPAAAQPGAKRPLLNRQGQPIRAEELPAPAEVRQQLGRNAGLGSGGLRSSGPREF